MCKILTFGILMVLVPQLRAQSTKAELFGVIRDPAGLPASGTSVKLVNTGTGFTRCAQAGSDGVYRFLALPPGAYRLSADHFGFAPLVREGITLRVGERLALDMALAIGGSSQQIEVTAAAPLLQASRGTAGYNVEQRKVVTLPLDGRNFVPLVALAPGVALPPGNLLPRINGSRPRVSEYIYDGVSVLQPEPGQVAFYPIVDAIDEFRVETNSFSAEYGRSNGGVIMVSQKSGSNILHGTLFEFFRNEALNARNLFASTGAKPRFRRNQYGFVLGGPIRHDKTFFFVDWQQTQLSTGVVRTSTIPTAAEQSGVFAVAIFDPASTRRTDAGYLRDAFPGSRIPLARIDSAARAAAGRYPAPNVDSGAGIAAAANNYRRTGNNDTLSDQFDTRLDEYFGGRHRLFGRYSFLRDDSHPTPPLPDGSGNLTSGVIGNTLTRADSLALEHTANVTAQSVNQLRVGYTRRGFGRNSLRTGEDIGATARIPNLPVTSYSDVLPTYDVAGYQQLGPPASSNAHFTTSVTQVVENYSWVRASHSLKAGADIRHEALDVLQPPSPTGYFQFTNIFTSGLTPAGAVMTGTGNSFASFLLGQVGQFRIDAQPQTLKPRANIAEFFLQDDWRVSNRLSLNLGVRYTLNFPSTVEGDRGAVFDLRRETLDFLGNDGFPRSARDLEKLNFAPRLGVAFKLTDSLVIRSGYGLTWIEQAGITTPFTTPLFPFIQTLSEQTLDNIHPAFTLSAGPTVRLQPPNRDSGLGQGVFGVQRDNGSGYAQQWNFMLQKTFGDNWTIEGGYLGSKLTRLGVPDANLNQLTVQQLALGTALTEPVANPYAGEIPANTTLGAPTIARAQLLRPFPRFTTVALYRDNIGHSTYHSFQSRLEKRFSRGLTLTASYTFSRLIDDAGAVFDSAILTGPVANFQAADSFNKRLEKDVSTGNIPHVFSSAFVYELPRHWTRVRILSGWRAGGILRAQSGSPVAVTQTTNFNAFAGFGIQRPNRVANPALDPARRSVSRWFDTSAFTPARQFTLGNSSRNPVSGPRYSALDLMLGKSFTLSERLRAEFRAEAFNVMNSPPLGNPNGNFGSAGFGSITTALDPRVFEFALKLQF
ncbi:MAG: TonB-dependent receptor [Bryobacterales bacterium]|nr:TonB-dependent receptor [Bryobacterales bacterium]